MRVRFRSVQSTTGLRSVIKPPRQRMNSLPRSHPFSRRTSSITSTSHNLDHLIPITGRDHQQQLSSNQPGRIYGLVRPGATHIVAMPIYPHHHISCVSHCPISFLPSYYFPIHHIRTDGRSVSQLLANPGTYDRSRLAPVSLGFSTCSSVHHICLRPLPNQEIDGDERGMGRSEGNTIIQFGFALSRQDGWMDRRTKGRTAKVPRPFQNPTDSVWKSVVGIIASFVLLRWFGGGGRTEHTHGNSGIALDDFTYWFRLFHVRNGSHGGAQFCK